MCTITNSCQAIKLPLPMNLDLNSKWKPVTYEDHRDRNAFDFALNEEEVRLYTLDEIAQLFFWHKYDAVQTAEAVRAIYPESNARAVAVMTAVCENGEEVGLTHFYQVEVE